MEKRHFEHECCEEIIDLLNQIHGLQLELLLGCKRLLQPQAVKISQGGFNQMITGTPAGGQSTFEADAILNGIADPAGFPAGTVDTWTVDDPAVTLTPNQGPNGNQVQVAVPLADTQGSAASGQPGSYNLKVSVQMPPATAGGTPPAPLTNTVNVPITPAPQPQPTGAVINQIS